MKAIQISAERQMGVVDIPEMEMKSDEVQLRLEYVGFCGSDLSTYLGKNPMVKMPVVPGHEVGAVIEKVGADVPDGLKPGMVVTCNHIPTAVSVLLAVMGASMPVSTTRPSVCRDGALCANVSACLGRRLFLQDSLLLAPVL